MTAKVVNRPRNALFHPSVVPAKVGIRPIIGRFG